MKVFQLPLPKLTKRRKFVLSVFVLSVLFFSILISTTGIVSIIGGVALSLFTSIILYVILKSDLKGSFNAPLFILPSMFVLSYALFDLLIPARLLSRILLTIFFAFGMYSLFLSHNIFAVSSSRTINLLRSARGVSFVLTLVILFFFINVIFSLHLFFLLHILAVFVIVSLLNFHSFWTYTFDRNMLGEIGLYAVLSALALAELSAVLLIWPVNATVYALFITGMFYTYSGLSHAWFEKRLFKGVFWEYIWVGFFVIIMLIRFAQWS